MDEVVNVTGEGTSPSSSATATAEPSTPTPIELKDDSFVKLPGSDKPVKYGEWFRGFQGKYTQATQERERLKAEAERWRQEAQKSGQPRPQAPQNPKAALVEKLKALPYVNGQEAAELVDSISSDIQVRDQAIKLLAGKLGEVMQTVQQLNQRRGVEDFQSKIGKFHSELGFPPEAKDFLEILYSAYEGEDLDEQFPTIAREQWEKLQAIVRAQDRKRVEEAKQKRFVPAKGGFGSPSKPLDTSRMSAKETADLLWDQLQAQGE